MLTILIIIGAVLLLLILIFLIVWKVHTRNFSPTSDKALLAANVNAELKETGFAYDMKGDYFYSLMNCWQREMGYCKAYDEGSPFFNMIMDCEPITFSYGGKRWLIELWKGQYGITTGGEIGIYNTTREDIDYEKFKGTFYEAVSDAELMPLSFVLKKNRKVLIRRSAIHWWLTGFKLGEFSQTDSLTMEARITFPDADMLQNFVSALQAVGYTKKEYSIKKLMVLIHYTKPHSPQPLTRNMAQETAVQLTNKNNCTLYELATHKYKFTLDKLEYLKTAMPEVYEFFLHSLYARGFYEAFKWLIDLIHDPKPEPPEPCPPRPPKPCPPEPPKPCPPKPPRPCPPEPPKPCPPEPPRPCPPEPPKPCPPEPPKPCPPEPPKPCPPEPPKPCPPEPPRPCPPEPPKPCPPEPPKPCPPEPPRPCPPKPRGQCPPEHTESCQPCWPNSCQPCRPCSPTLCPPRQNIPVPSQADRYQNRNSPVTDRIAERETTFCQREQANEQESDDTQRKT